VSETLFYDEANVKKVQVPVAEEGRVSRKDPPE
jgi:hypothetical protein